VKGKLGDIVVVRYYDHILFKDAASRSGALRPLIREAVGWLDYEDADYIRLVWERYAEPIITDESRLRTTGLAIRKADVMEIRRLSGSQQP
jgi:hypothetical protein